MTAFAHVFAMMAPWLVFGFLMAGAIAVWIPRSWVNRVMGGSSGFGGILRAVAIGVPLPVCSTASIPIAASLIAKGVSPGAAFVFLMVGPAMNAMSLTTVSALVGRKAAVVYLVTILVGAILCGVVINLIPNAASASVLAASTRHALSPVHWVPAVFLAVMMVYNLVRPVAMGHRKCSTK